MTTTDDLRVGATYDVTFRVDYRRALTNRPHRTRRGLTLDRVLRAHDGRVTFVFRPGRANAYNVVLGADEIVAAIEAAQR